MSEFVIVTSWVQDTGMHLYPNTDIGGKYTVLSNGELYINNAGPSDAFKTYTCRTVNRLTGKEITRKKKFNVFLRYKLNGYFRVICCRSTSNSLCI